MDLSSVSSKPVSSASIVKTASFPRDVSLSNDSFESNLTAEHTQHQELPKYDIANEIKQQIFKPLIERINVEIKNLSDNLIKAKQSLESYNTETSKHISEITFLLNSTNRPGLLQTLKNTLHSPVFFSFVDGKSSMNKCQLSVTFLKNTAKNFDLSKLQGKDEEISGLIENFENFKSKLSETKKSYDNILRSLSQKYEEQVKSSGNEKNQTK